jgi:hypothetical protein
MKLKELAYSAQNHLQAATDCSFKRAHIYELLAASFGYKSYTAFGVDAVLTWRRPGDTRPSPHRAGVRKRCNELGYQSQTAERASSALTVFLDERQIGAMTISALADQLRRVSLDQNSDGDWLDADDEVADPMLVEGLEMAASNGNVLAHSALAMIYAPNDADEKPEVGSDYWHTQGKKGRILTGVEKAWADAYESRLVKAAKYTHHLREAARLGQQDALLELADRFNDPAFFEQTDAQVDADPALVAEIARRLGRPNDARKWLTIAAEAGDTESMRTLIEHYDHGDPLRCWTWLYLAALVGTDLTQDQYYAIHEDGSRYDDDVGGNAFVAGRGGIELDPLTAERDTAARYAAQGLFKRISE